MLMSDKLDWSIGGSYSLEWFYGLPHISMRPDFDWDDKYTCAIDG